MNVFEVKATTQAEEQIREIAYHISALSTIAEKDSALAEMDLLLQKYKEKYGDL